MARDLLTVCLPPTPPGGVTAAIAAAMAPYDYDFEEQPGGPAWQGEWDSWHVYGGHDGDGFPVSPADEADPRLIFEPTLPNGAVRQRTPSRWDGGPRALLDFDAARAPVAARAAEHWRAWQEFTEGFPPAVPFDVFAERARQDLAGYPVARARADYYGQPLITAANDSAEVCGLFPRLTDPLHHFRGTRAEFIRRETAQVVPTNHLLTLDGQWIDGTVEDWGRRIGRSGDYHLFADAYLENLPGDCLVVRLRFHS
ncbi:hypothetical protein AB0D10_42980 [Kitasatospora sp. NPDC048545]|uniref:hypothetical protein n=1 Tax=Kitasatospora sp. NPDC048545 TaxID=3157208 RepID=UPI00340102C1